MPRSSNLARTDWRALCKIRGPVQEGKQIGRTIGFPTANIAMPEDSTLPHGIYVSLIRLNGGFWRDCISYVGRRPTVSGTTLLLETHIFDFDQSIYGVMATVELIEQIRGDATFADLDALKAQIAKDCWVARQKLRTLDRPAIAPIFWAVRQGAASTPPSTASV